MWDCPISGVELVSPTLAGGLFTTSHQGSPKVYFFLFLKSSPLLLEDLNLPRAGLSVCGKLALV